MGRFVTAVISLFILVAFALSGDAGNARPKFPPDESLIVPSLTLTDEQFLKGKTADGVSVTLTGELRFPNWDEELPAVVILHGNSGPVSSIGARWSALLNKMGIATFRLDSFGGRGVVNLSIDQSQLSFVTRFYDVYRAVDVLAAHPRIDPSRIAVLGYSSGGTSALYTGLSRFQKLHGPTKTRIAAHVAFYGACNIQFIDELDVADAPIREFHGSADNQTLAAPCRDYITRLHAAGKDAVMNEYPGAHHGFDAPDSVPSSMSQTSRNCQRREEDGKIVNVATNKPFTSNDACMELGSTERYDKAAAEAAQAAVKQLLTEVFRLN
ncbi:dienelactone hydrolase family protein [Phyllobacterium chamaecytisi]|uniref:dienelactone hydrolase family protein n=1 Tax=Phyllobacterium chamaecytisi TaxID=2876082 RepID=UPI001CCEAE04|nr:dienelactone hydrolase family protein [Phyllobacterium sp. KW56]MBZ9606028.1 dienelactone hydrolase family protein [Phyllobacterium sp. KW56]